MQTQRLLTQLSDKTKPNVAFRVWDKIKQEDQKVVALTFNDNNEMTIYSERTSDPGKLIEHTLKTARLFMSLDEQSLATING